MKKLLLTLLLVCISIIVCAQSKKELQKDNGVLRSRIEAIQEEVDVLVGDNLKLSKEVDSLKQVLNHYASLQKAHNELTKAYESLRKETPQQNQNDTRSASSTSKSKSSITVSTKNRTSTPAYSGRCQATTKKGTQCSRNAQSGRHYCWQH
ncbi:hypothetical protein [uncultured Alistipes sp.]|jgi:hypothetical protein|uniref:hypothetical protein n=1 Tax=uncultured Alistipes sp. TaxID=538949 RepID=UPI0025CE4492|nr:hypothetical protein [uncultured Alistipes sp.]